MPDEHKTLPIFPTIKTVIADAGHQSRKLRRLIKAEGYELRIVKRRKRAFEVARSVKLPLPSLSRAT